MKRLKKLHRSGLCFLWVAILILAIDRISKYWVLQHFVFFEPVKILPMLDITLAYNTGAAFSFLHNATGWQNGVLGGLAVVVSMAIIVWLAKQSAREWWINTALSLILAGALGNAWDRLIYEYVIDFISFHIGNWHFAIFNIADSAISVGAVMLFWHWWRQAKLQAVK